MEKSDQLVTLNQKMEKPDQLVTLNQKMEKPDQLVSLNQKMDKPDQLVTLNQKMDKPDHGGKFSINIMDSTEWMLWSDHMKTSDHQIKSTIQECSDQPKVPNQLIHVISQDLSGPQTMTAESPISVSNQVLTLVGYILLIIPNGLSWYWGGISVYILSYAVYRLDAGHQVEQPWVVSIFYIAWTCSLVTIGISAIDKRLVLLTGSTIGIGILLVSYITLQKSLLLFEIMLGALVGIADGMIQSVALYYVVKVAGKRVGLFSSVLVSGHSLGSLGITQMFTWYINPKNKSPQVKFGSTKYFCETEIIDVVPSTFMLFGFITLGFHGVGYSLLLLNAWLNKRRQNRINTERQPILPGVRQPDSRCFEREILKDKESRTEPAIEVSPKSDTKLKKDYSPSEILRSPIFYALWVSFFIADFPFVLLINFYKLYGQIWIADDHFLSNLGTAFILVSTISRIPWGMAVDKFGVRNSMITLLTSILVTVSWYYFTPMVNRWLYFFTTIVYGSFGGALYSYYLAATSSLFGPKHVPTNFALVTSSSMLFNVAAPILIDRMLSRLGWFAVFAVAGGMNIVGILLCMIAIP